MGRGCDGVGTCACIKGLRGDSATLRAAFAVRVWLDSRMSRSVLFPHLLLGQEITDGHLPLDYTQACKEGTWVPGRFILVFRRQRLW